LLHGGIQDKGQKIFGACIPEGALISPASRRPYGSYDICISHGLFLLEQVRQTNLLNAALPLLYAIIALSTDTGCRLVDRAP